jgi:hypothetical protein
MFELRCSVSELGCSDVDMFQLLKLRRSWPSTSRKSRCTRPTETAIETTFRMVSAEGIESALKRTFNKIQSNRRHFRRS